MDQYVMNESDYNKCNYNKNDIWLDAGANIGSFPIKYHNKVKKIICYEPEQNNFDLLNENIKLNNIKNCVTYMSCLVENNDKQREFYLNKATNKGLHSLIIKRGRDIVNVNCVNINDVIKKHNINKIKMDVEGAEYKLIKSIDFTSIDEIIFEYHLKHLKDFSKIKYNEIIKLIKQNFKKIDYKENLKGNWQTIIHAKK